MDIIHKLSRIQNIPQGYRVTAPPPPVSVKIELTSRCNYRCSYCSYTHREANPQTMDWELFTRITKEMKGLGVEEIGVFYIGESFIEPQLLVDAITYLKNELGFPYVFLTSNASLALPNVVESCMQANLDSLKWSCNSADENQFKFVMNVSPKLFHLSLDNIRKAWEIRQEKGYKTKLYASSIKYDDAQIDKMSGFLDRYVKPYVDRHYWLPLYTMGGVTMKNEDGKINQPVAGNPGSIEQPVAPIPCWTLFSGHILVDGRMTACCMDGMGKWVVGDLKEKSFMECWHSEKFQSLRRAHLAGDIRGTECENCALVGYGANNG